MSKAMHNLRDNRMPMRQDTTLTETPPTEAPGEAERAWLLRGLGQPGGKLPLFDEEGQRIPAETIDSCLKHGWAEPWFSNPLKPDWVICKLTPNGRALLGAD